MKRKIMNHKVLNNKNLTKTRGNVNYIGLIFVLFIITVILCLSNLHIEKTQKFRKEIKHINFGHNYVYAPKGFAIECPNIETSMCYTAIQECTTKIHYEWVSNVVGAYGEDTMHIFNQDSGADCIITTYYDTIKLTVK